jgi:hypothetical protein
MYEPLEELLEQRRLFEEQLVNVRVAIREGGVQAGIMDVWKAERQDLIYRIRLLDLSIEAARLREGSRD